MSDHTILALMIVATPSAALLTGFAIRELRLQRAARRGWLVTYGITGNPADLDAQITDLHAQHDAAAGVRHRHNVVPFPARRGGVA